MPVVAHHEVLARWNNQLAVGGNVIVKIDGPLFWNEIAGLGNRSYGGKLIEKVRVILVRRRLRVGLTLSHAVDKHDAVAQVNVIAANADQPLHQDQETGRSRFRIRVGDRLVENATSPRWGSR